MRRRESGQAVVEFALILLVFLTLTAGLIDVGRSVFLYNELGAISRYGARFGSVVGGTCGLLYARSTSDWCNQFSGGGTANFWTQLGNKPLQGYGVECPTYAGTPADWYTGSSYSASTSSTIVGSIADRFDTDINHTNLFANVFAPGVDLTNLHVCIETTNTTSIPAPGDSITINVLYPFTPAGKLFGTGTFNMTSESQYVIE